MPSRADYLLDPDLVFLNHGSYGATPAVVMDEYQRLQREMERNPVLWLGRRADELMSEARARLAAFVGSRPDDLVFFPNPTTAMAMVARSLRLQPGDQVLTTDHEYGAMDRLWRKTCAEAQADYRRVHIPLPVTTHDDLVERVWSAVTPRTRVLFLSHITSATGLVFPVEALCRRARDAGVLAIVDGAHVPGQLPLQIESIGCDLYAAAAHKWLAAPKGCSFLWATPEVQAWLEPLVVSWGWESERPSASRYVDHHEYQGTRDLSAFLAIAAAIDFVEHHDWGATRAEGHHRALRMRRLVNALTGLAAISPDSTDWIGQMAAIRLPAAVDVVRLQRTLFDEHRIEVPMHRWHGEPFLRVSCAGHTIDADGDALVAALGALLPG
jgi:isopenicillin-N epimerase